jgi:hypothetical protein
MLLIGRKRLGPWLIALSTRMRLAALIVSTLVVSGVWLTSIELPARQYLTLNGLLFTVIIILSFNAAGQPAAPLRTTTLFILLLLLPPMGITALGQERFTPDEGHWADYATSPFRAGGLYSSTWLQAPVTIAPGLGWSVAAYGWTLEHIAFDLKTGRTWNFAVYLLAFGGVGGVAWRLYGRGAALISAVFAALSLAFIPVLDYRPDHQLPAAGMFAAFALLQGRHTRRWFWHTLCGLIVTLALQLHAAAIVFITGFSLCYIIDAALAWRAHGSWGARWPLAAFGLGGLIGGGVYFIFNVQPVGGLSAFLQALMASRGQVVGDPKFWTWPSLLEWAVILAAFAYLGWRRAPADRAWLGLVVCVLVGVILFDTQGYRSHFSAFYVVPVGALVTGGFIPRRSTWAALALMIALALQMAGSFIQWRLVTDWVRGKGFPPFLYTELRPILTPYVRSDDVIASTHQLIWTFPEHRQLIHVGAEATALGRWALTDPAAVWERVQPTVIVYLDGQMSFNPGLEAYMARHRFQPCVRLRALETHIVIYRTSCDTVESD